MTDNEIKILVGLQEQKKRLTLALDEFRAGASGQDIQTILEPSEMAEVRAIANLAVENKLTAMLRGATAQLEAVKCQ